MQIIFIGISVLSLIKLTNNKKSFCNLSSNLSKSSMINSNL